jgi:hypothetical protein
MFNIYKITNRDTGRVYIGMTEKTIHARFRRHMLRLRDGSHVNIHLQADFNRGHSFIITKITHRKHKHAKSLETKLMNEIENTYNIARGNPGDMAGYLAYRFTDANRSYMYAEIIDMRDKPGKEVRPRFNISQPMVSMIQLGHRKAGPPQTTFRDVFFCDQTEVKVAVPPVSNFLRVYLGNYYANA